MSGNSPSSKKWWPWASSKDLAIFGLIWWGEGFLILLFVESILRLSPLLYLLMLPWSGLGLIMAARPNWIMRMNRTIEDKINRDMEKGSKWWDVF